MTRPIPEYQKQRMAWPGPFWSIRCRGRLGQADSGASETEDGLAGAVPSWPERLQAVRRFGRLEHADSGPAQTSATPAEAGTTRNGPGQSARSPFQAGRRLGKAEWRSVKRESARQKNPGHLPTRFLIQPPAGSVFRRSAGGHGAESCSAQRDGSHATERGASRSIPTICRGAGTHCASDSTSCQRRLSTKRERCRMFSVTTMPETSRACAARRTSPSSAASSAVG